MGATLRSRLLSVRDLLATAWPIVLVVTIGFVVAYQFVKPAPPSRLAIATGSESGAYHAFAQRYATILARSGVTLELKPSAGSLESIERLKKGEVDVAFVQGGVLPAPAEGDAADDGLRLASLGSMYYEPVWVFYRGEQPLGRLHDLAGKRIAVGAEGSGVRGLATQLLEANEILLDRNLKPLAGLEAAEALQQGWVDAAFVIAAPEAPVVQVLLRSPGVRVMSFAQADAYTRRFPFLTRVTLPRGVVDLVRDLPPRSTTLLAATANLVVNEDTHPALVALLLQAASEVHGKSGFFQKGGEFPSYLDTSFELSDDAARYYKSGPPFLQRYLPFWAAVFVDRMVVMLLPLLALLLPLLRVAPAIYTWRVRSKIFRLYGELKFLENEVRHHYAAERHGEFFARLDRIEEEASNRNVPLGFTDLVYTLREHVNLVRKQLLRFERQQGEQAKP
ncbi:TAXI family TRAP transporter solute-binding subunit [Azospira restricta]|uniref:TAXI family TRAP transporter solute-binding subunit n=1 Tax=Azospira restricta TaxID=404405 RepID=A0A974SP53_9RHOO|nr:TAXI family TRAP transporter solute-binding subunit [Azospira restricta]QRJ63882.1 TAXI family TRAP transporter solute-binding subunit [Azospira restricta]